MIIVLSAYGGGGGSPRPKVTKKQFVEVEDTVDGPISNPKFVLEIVNQTNEPIWEFIGTSSANHLALNYGPIYDQNYDTQPTQQTKYLTRTYANPDFVDWDSNEENDALRVGQYFTYTLNENTFDVPKGGEIKYRLAEGTVLPDGIKFDPSTRTFSGTPEPLKDSTDYMQSYDIKIIGESNGRTGNDIMIFQVIQPNRSPILTNKILDIEAKTGDFIKININKHFVDPDRDYLSFSAVGLPAGLEVRDFNRWLFGFPTEVFEGDVIVTARDFNGLEVSKKMHVKITLSDLPIEWPTTKSGRMIGDHDKRDIFDLNSAVGEPKPPIILGFAQGQDKIYIGDRGEIFMKEVDGVIERKKIKVGLIGIYMVMRLRQSIWQR